MHQESDSIRKSDIFRGVSGIGFHLVFSDRLNCECIFIVSFLVEPILDASDGFGYVVSIGFEVIVIDIRIVVQIRLINKMPAGLPTSSVIFDVVGESNTFSERVFIFTNWEARILKDRKD